MKADGSRRRARVPGALAGTLALFLVGACATQRIEPDEPVRLVQAATEIPESELLDVGVQVFDPGLGEDERQLPENVFPDVRRSESTYLAVRLKEALQETGQWGAVRVLPSNMSGVDVLVTGEILESTGKDLAVRVKAVDATGDEWFERTYKAEADSRAYSAAVALDSEPFQYLYNQICNDLLVKRERLEAEELHTVRRVSELKFAADLAPDVFGDYLVQRRGRYTAGQLPAAGDPMMVRVAYIREREHMLVDVLDTHYATFSAQMDEPYDGWRQYSYVEQVSMEKLKRKALTQQILGALAVVGGIFVQADSATEAAIRDLAVLGGMAAVNAGLATAEQAKIHVEALKELGASLEAEVAPMVIEVEGKTLRLQGSAATQYEEWRQLLREIWTNEVGLPVDPNVAKETASATPGNG